MPIPEFTVDGVLPPGLHECTEPELRDRFGGFFVSTKREKLMARLEEYLKDVRSSGLVSWIAVDGSFVTDKREPGDIDLVVVLPKDHDYNYELRPFEYNTLDHKMAKRLFGFDVIVVPEGSEAQERILSRFSEVRDRPDVRKGMLRLTP